MPGSKTLWIRLFSAAIPGAGHAMLGHWLTGGILASIYAALVIAILFEGAGWDLGVTAFAVWLLAQLNVWELIENKGFLAVHYLDPSAAAKLDAYLATFNLPTSLSFLCPGCDNLGGDAFGPYVGDLLARYGYPSVLGTTTEQVNALSWPNYLQTINTQDFVIVIDAAIGSRPELDGLIIVRPGAISPGSALGKKLPCFGHLSILFISAVYRPGQPLAIFDDPMTSSKSAAAAATVAEALHRRLQCSSRAITYTIKKGSSSL